VHWTGWIVVGLVAFTGGWMLFDGLHALTTGDFVTPKSGGYAGQLGPWTGLVSAVGLEPRSTLMKAIFVGYGVVCLVVAAAFALRVPGSWWAVLAMAVLGLWYLPFGTAANAIVVAVLLISPLRGGNW
jgi:hypothetical protein